MRVAEREVDFCVVGGGLAGMCAAVSAARRGARVCLLHDRPVWGGNASSEVRMWICGAQGANCRETGLIEEIQLENLFRNPTPTYAGWDAVLHSFIRAEPRIDYALNCAVHAGRMEDGRLAEVTGYESLSQTFHRVKAKLFADCSGDSILARISGAPIRLGRESSAEFGEDIAPPAADRKTMGNTCLPQFREHPAPQPFIAPPWARRFGPDDFFGHRPGKSNNFWWLELGGEDDSVHDAAALREKLLPLVYGVWDYLKNRAPDRDIYAHWSLDWVGFLTGKRESLRYAGDHVLTQRDIRSGGRFPDLAAYGGWPMDDHHPAGFATREPATIFHPVPSPYGIPYRCLYSAGVPNLFCAGRNISATHAALSSTRVMATCALMGQAVGAAAAIAVRRGLEPRGVGAERIDELRQALMEDDCWLPGAARRTSALSWPGVARYTASAGDPEPLRNGRDRPVDGETPNDWTGVPGKDWVACEFDGPRDFGGARLVFDSDLDRKTMNMPCWFPLDAAPRRPPSTLVKDFRVEVRDEAGRWTTAARVEANAQRLVRLELNARGTALRMFPEATWGAERARLFAFEPDL